MRIFSGIQRMFKDGGRAAIGFPGVKDCGRSLVASPSAVSEVGRAVIGCICVVKECGRALLDPPCVV